MGGGWGKDLESWRKDEKDVGERGCSQVMLVVKHLPVNAGDIRDRV